MGQPLGSGPARMAHRVHRNGHHLFGRVPGHPWAVPRGLAGLVEVAGWRISNVDATMLAQKPTLGHLVEAMRQQVSGALSITLERVGIKVTTTDYLGFVGREEGIGACAVASLISKNPGISGP